MGSDFETIKSNITERHFITRKKRMFAYWEAVGTFLKPRLKSIGVPAERFVVRWRENVNCDINTLYGIREYCEKNIEIMESLERSNPGSVRFLNTTFGIFNFTNFSVHTWNTIFEQRESKDPYVLVIVPTYLGLDTKPNAHVYLSLQKKLSQLDPPHALRVIEVRHKRDLLRLMLRLTRKYHLEEYNPIRSVVFDGHGLEHRLLFGEAMEKGELSNEDIHSKRFAGFFFKILPGVFYRNTEFIFGSCESARHPARLDRYSSVANEFKRLLTTVYGYRVNVFGSSESVSRFSSIDPCLQGGQLHLDCSFEDGESRLKKL